MLPAPPIAVLGCSTGVTTSDMLVKTDGTYRISFVDRDTRTVDDIRFVVRLGEQRIYIRDTGKFSPGITIDHRFPDRGGEIVLVGAPKIACEILSVRFDDGSEWLRR